MFDTARKFARRVSFRLLDLAGVNWILRRKNAMDIRVFTLHGVVDYSAPSDWEPLRYQVDTGHLRQILASLMGKYRFITMDEAAAMIEGSQPVDSPVIALTFDDGLRNNFTQALPILEEFGVPATFYVATSFVESRQPFWFDRLDYVLQVVAEQGGSYEVYGREFQFGPGGRELIRSQYDELRRYCKENIGDEDEFVRVLTDLAERMEQQTGRSLAAVIESDAWSCVATKQELHDVVQHPLVTIGSHTVNHVRLSCATDEVVSKELAVSKQKLEEWTGETVDHFAYPNGDYDDRSEAAVIATGYQSAATSDPGVNSVGDDVAAILRLNIGHDCTVPEICARASGLEAALTRLVRQLTFRAR